MEERKSFKDISWNVTEEEYRADPAYSYSTLARFEREGFENLDKLYEKVESPSLTFGSMVDTLITDGRDEFDKKFFIAQFPKIDASIKTNVEIIFDRYSDKYKTITEIPDSLILAVTNETGYQPNYKPETRVRYIKEKGGEPYYNLMFLSKGKQIVTQEDYNDAMDCVHALYNSPQTENYFNENYFDSSIEHLYQLKFKGDFQEIPVRCMADLLIVDHKNKRIIPIDLKTSYKPEYKFFWSFMDWLYNIQARLYWYIIRQNMDKDPYFKDFILEDYRFVVISKGTKNPLVWKYVDTTKTGTLFYGRRQQYKCRDWREIVKELHFYQSNEVKVPTGIQVNLANDIVEWLNKY